MVLRKDFRLDNGGIPLALALFSLEEAELHPGLVICHGMPVSPRPGPGTPTPPDEDPGYPTLTVGGVLVL